VPFYFFVFHISSTNSYIDGLSFWRLDSEDNIVELLVEADILDVVEHGQQVGLDGVWVARLTQNLQQGGVRHEEETREQQTLLLKVPIG